MAVGEGGVAGAQLPKIATRTRGVIQTLAKRTSLFMATSSFEIGCSPSEDPQAGSEKVENPFITLRLDNIDFRWDP